MLSDEDGLCDRTWDLPGFEALWFEIASQPAHRLWFCALWHLRDLHTPAARQALRSLAQRQPELEDPERVLEALLADDELETSRVLVPFARRKRDPTWLQLRTSALAQLWRTGRTSELGLCGKPEHTRRVEALPPPAGAHGEIGTRHPLLLQALAADGRWCIICQARTDTNHDGEISASIGRHGDTVGDIL